MINKSVLLLVATVLVAGALPFSADAADERRMGPAQRLLHDGARPSHRDQARAEVRRARSIRTRGRVYDEVRSAQDARIWQTKKPAKAPKLQAPWGQQATLTVDSPAKCERRLPFRLN